MQPAQPKLTFSLSTLLISSFDESDMLNGAVRDTYLTPTQPHRDSPGPTQSTLLVRGTVKGGVIHHQNCITKPDKTEGLAGNDSYSFSDFVRYTSEQSQKEHPCTTFAPDTTAWDTELELSLTQGGDADKVLPQNAVQEATHGYRASYRAEAPPDESRYSNCPSTSCLCLCVGGTLCLQEISCATVPSHFVGHGIENKSRKEAIRCMWKGCVKTVARHTFVRHIREVHLGHVRGTRLHSWENDSGQQAQSPFLGG
ncbi:hypothetical protein F5J12DRAFT_779687 [Pisolithus orientalis]|uniref:uncharacterized protein n=1 Tax=Pisolithus orientalis TaxID=936130 RepID=UPI0022246267|nr:uncharacterized protein F5J12DRAFT_779687 [Pisolithus orientalis]KAI6030560.1 hypothetical protein F5J12DRAFT_779687 [Pisolithus orientalis]